MSEPKSLAQIIGEMVADSSNPIGQQLRRCPLVRTELINKGVLLEDDEDSVEQAILEDWIDNQDVMSRLHISVRTLQKLRSNGILPYTKVNGKIYYLRQDVEELLNRNYGRKQQ
ncbi:MAG: helix-turn-helix domain-containing protein [Bacteroidales bacterium]|nr:helix-turn-helix domain-containing protein [Bacteroidales bacterium]